MNEDQLIRPTLTKEQHDFILGLLNDVPLPGSNLKRIGSEITDAIALGEVVEAPRPEVTSEPWYGHGVVQLQRAKQAALEAQALVDRLAATVE